MLRHHCINTTLAGLIALISTSCKTTDPVVQVAREKNQITVFGSRERGSALTHAADSKQIAETATLIDNKLQKDPKNVSLLLDRARIFLIKDDVKNARLMCNRALRLDLHNKNAAKLLGEIELADNNLAKAEIIMYRLGGREAKDAEVLNILGLVALRRDELDDAYTLFQDGLKVDPNNSALRMNIGIIHLQHRQMEPAAREFQQVLKVLPNHIDAKLHLAITKAYAGKLVEAKQLYNEVIDADRDNVYAQYNLALLETRTGELKEALSHVQKALKGKDLSPIQQKIAQDLRGNLQAQIKQKELDEQEEAKRKDLEKKKKAEGRVSHDQVHVLRSMDT